ncbi:hypothetical protein JQ617_03400 [Bradyrhizobium sp. KB893862 SZCCT0404]|uniref:hypothetical protein n=1 Tax=Bradyrhizobium sp. KB893862 SZCCT0404 TaxID=2807672 RepID=UPI001BA73899|nr:hypothetical protein [Bradyrhizobium sp. KB893862 SZCCT0404]MBR1172991.1 hypothetical protein [Bradyrhizobium sp. KB893862 SZCCT0404]
MEVIQWTVAAGTALFVALVGFFQWRTAQDKAAFDLFERRHDIFQIVRRAVQQMVSSSPGFDQAREIEFTEMMERAYFFFGDDVHDYLNRLWNDIVDVRTADSEMAGGSLSPTELTEALGRRRKAMSRIEQFYKTGQPLFAKYMRFCRQLW